MEREYASPMLPPNGHGGSLAGPGNTPTPPVKKKSRRGNDSASQKRRCVSTACVACRRRKSKCDGALPSCAACASVYGTECVYNPNTDHRRKGVYREKVDTTKAQSSTLQILIEAILNAAEEDVPSIVKMIRTCDSLDTVAEAILKQDFGHEDTEDEGHMDEEDPAEQPIEGERALARKMGELRIENGSMRFIGGTSHLIYLGDPSDIPDDPGLDVMVASDEPLTSWTSVTADTQLIIHLINMYFAWHYPYFATLSKSMFYRDFLKGRPTGNPNRETYCSPLLVNAMLALGCHFTNVGGAYGIPGDSRTKGDHFFAEAKRLIVENDENEKPRLTTVQALALMSVREAGCGREARGWSYSGMSFRMAQDIGLNLDAGGLSTEGESLNEQAIDARRITFWGCFLFDKCWSNYLGRLPQLPKTISNVPKYDVFPNEDAESWSPYTDVGFDETAKQASRTRAVGLQLSKLCEISSDLLLFFYHPNHIGRSSGKAVELKKLSELHRRLEDWRKELPKEFEPKDGQLPNVLLMHMFFHLQYIHLFRPFLKYSPSTSPLPVHVSPRRICTANAGAISKLTRLYKKLYNLRQICNIAVYMIHSACCIHLLNLPEKTAKRDIIHGVKHLEEIAEDWLCARRTLCILSVLARKWNVELPEEAAAVLQRTDEKYGSFSTSDVPSPNKPPSSFAPSPTELPRSPASHASKPEQYSPPNHPSRSNTSNLPADLAVSAMAPEVLQSLTGMSPAGSVQTPPTQYSRPGPTSGMAMSDAMAGANAWAMPSMMQPVQGYASQAYSPVQQTPQPAVNRTNGTPGSFMGIDGQDWYLKDGVTWHQNFESWGLSPVAGPGQPSPASNGMADPNMFLFRAMRTAEGDGSPFESLDNSMDALDNLPGLE